MKSDEEIYYCLVDTGMTWDDSRTDDDILSIIDNISVDSFSSANLLAVVSDVLENDCLLYKSPFTAKTYLVRGSGKKTILGKQYGIFGLWKLDEWRYDNSPFINSTKKFEISVQSIIKKQNSWDGEFHMGKEPCIPAGYANNGAVEVRPGHYFSRNYESAAISNIKNKNGLPVDDRTLRIKGTILSGETNMSITDANLIVGVVSENNLVKQPASKFSDEYTNRNFYCKYAASVLKDKDEEENKGAAINNDGTFTIDINYGDLSANTGEISQNNAVIAIVINVDPDDETNKYKYIKSIYVLDSSTETISEISKDNTEIRVLNKTFYLFDDTAGRKSKNLSYSGKYSTINEFNICHYISCYNTSKPVITYVYNKYRTFTINSDLTENEKRNIRIVAEFVKDSNMNIATVSSCIPEKFIPADNAPTTDTYTAYGRLSNLNYHLNFDNEDLRNFSIVVKDFSEGNDTDKFESSVIIPEHVYQNYNIYIYAYYRTQPSVYKKIQLGPDRVIINE